MDNFHPSIQRWFANRFEAPTAVQSAAWPVIGAGKHALVTAPTGSGKTLTGFLWALSKFASGDYLPGATRVLYISPMKALNNDISRNLSGPLAELQRDYDYPELRVRVRSGDTSQGDRQRMLRSPPDILITTPESLNLLLTTVRGRHALSTVEAVVLDEVHALVEDRRGVLLLTALERLVELSGEVQRIALSATVTPLDAVARYIAGRDATGRPRPITIVDAPIDKRIEFRVHFPEQARVAAENGKKIWDPLADSFRDVIRSNSSTLFFANSRMLTEKITLKINEGSAAPIAYAHHGSLSRELRGEVERRLKDGELDAIVATNSLELGIDVGDLDEVVLVQSPPTIASTLQRIGRAGHQVGATSRGSLFPTHARDFLDAAVLSEAVKARDLEPLKPIEGPLDVLAQILISTTATEDRELDALYAMLRRSGPYANLDRVRFDLVVDMLAGRYAGDRVRALKTRLSVDRIDGRARALKSAVLAMYAGGGTIPDRGYYRLRHVDTGANIGELDEEFVWEAKIGQNFTFGTQHWQVQRITASDVLVRPAKSTETLPPFWRAETQNRSYHFSRRIGRFLGNANTSLGNGERASLLRQLADERGFDEAASEELVGYLERQREATGCALPHRDLLVAEWITSGPGGYKSEIRQQQLVLHTFWGGRVNKPFAFALDAAWQNAFDERAEIHADNDAIAIQTALDVSVEDVLGLVREDNLNELLRASLESTGFFGARFRECAGRALLLSKRRFDTRMPLWMTRLQAKKLMSASLEYDDFPLLLETWRTCLVDEFEIDALAAELRRIEDGRLAVTVATTSTPSPFAANITFSQINRYMYADDTPEDPVRSALSSELIDGVATGTLAGLITPEVVAEFEAKRQRTAAGYEPDDMDGWLLWVRERVLLPEAEAGAAPEHERLRWLSHDGRRWLVHAELLGALSASGWLGDATFTGSAVVSDVPQRSALAWACEFVSFYGPRSADELSTLMPSVPEALFDTLVSGRLLRDDSREVYCDPDNYEQLLRFQRLANRPSIDALPASRWPVFIAEWQGLLEPAPSAATAALASAATDRAQQLVESIRGASAPLTHWLYDISGARNLDPGSLEALVVERGFDWRGTGKESITLLYSDEHDLLTTDVAETAAPTNLASLFADPGARYPFGELTDRSGQSSDAFNESFWTSVWQGLISADSLRPLEVGLERRFAVTDVRSTARRRGRVFAPIMTWPGNWRLLPDKPAIDDPVTELELAKDRARMLLDRYGVVCRELANRDGGTLRWAAVFRALRLMELAGEVFSGLFFDGFSGPQFAATSAIGELRRAQQETSRDDLHWWLAAFDPASPCGLGGVVPLPEANADQDESSAAWPARRTGNFIAFVAGEPALIVENWGRRMSFLSDWNNPNIDAAMPLLRHLLSRRTGGGRGNRRFQIDEINRAPSRTSPYLDALGRHFDVVRDHKTVVLQ